MRLFLITLILPFCNASSKMEGQWIDNTNKKWHFTENNKVIWLHKSDTIAELDYLLSAEQIQLLTSGCEIGKLHYSFLNQDKLLIWSYKPKDLSNHIDEVALLKRVGANHYLFAKNSSTFIVPKNLFGQIAIAYSDSIDSLKTIHIDSALSYTNQKADIRGFATRSYLFKTKSGDSLTTIYDLKQAKLHLDSIYVYVKGFNQSARNVYNDYFKTNIQGNLLDIEIDTLKNLLK